MTIHESDHFAVDEDPRCPACGEGIQWCQGHGQIGDPGGALVLDHHDNDNHAGCHPAGCEAAAARLQEERVMKILDCGPLAVCADCIMLIANDEGTDQHRTAMAEWADGYGDGAILVPGDEEHDFSKARCDGCGSTLAGSRHEVFALVPEGSN